jgi:porin
MKVRYALILLAALFSTALCHAQASAVLDGAASGSSFLSPEPVAHRFADLNLIGGDTRMPGFEDTQAGTDVGWRRAMLRYGMALRVNTGESFSDNMLDPAVAPSKQAYTGERPYGRVMANPIFTWDLRVLHLRGAQLNVAAGLQWVSWNKAGPRAADLNTLYIYKSFAEGKVEIKVGYPTNNLEFVGFSVGGSLGPGAQGVYSVLPYEAGMSYLPLTAPGLNVKWNAPKHFYAKGGLQRSTDAAGGAATIARNRVGLRFDPSGDGLVTIIEGGFNRVATDASRSMWIRGGYIGNTTEYTNALTGGKSSGNFCGFLLADRQITRAFGERSGNGLYLGGSAEIVPARLNAYSQYYELRAYLQGPFRSRPLDQAALLATRSVHSQDNLRVLMAQGKSVWRHTNTVTASYSLHAARGVYLSAGLSYQQGAAITPRVPTALVGTLSMNTFF